MSLVPLVVALPLLSAAVLAAFGTLMRPSLQNLVAATVSLAVTVMCVVLVFRSSAEPITYWFGGWEPRHGVAIGISFGVEPLSAGLAALVGALATAASIVSWDYFHERVPPYFHVLMLVFVGAMVGFVLSSDLFNMFVFFEVMSVAAFALTGYRIEQPSALQGAINFAVVNSIGAFMLLTGIALLYGRTGALNLAQIGRTLERGQPDGLVVVAFTLIVVGFLTKAGAIPFHFWLSDAYAVAPVPVCVLFAGVMSDLGLHGIARTYWDAFAGTLAGDAGSIRGVFVGIGIATAVLGGVLAFFQSSVKRMLAFVVIAHIGVFLAALGLLTARGLAGATLYLAADGLAKGAVFCGLAHVSRRTGHTDELLGHGLARGLPGTGLIVALGALALAMLPPLAFLSTGGWLPVVFVCTSALTGGALLRAAARLFLGLGPKRDPLLMHAPAGEEREVPPTPRGGALLWVPAVALLIGAYALAFVPALAERAVAHAGEFVGVADGPGFRPTLGTYTWAIGAGLAAPLAAWAGLYRRRLPELLRRSADRLLGPSLDRLKLVHDGVVGEYVTWLTLGAAVLGGLFAALIR